MIKGLLGKRQNRMLIFNFDTLRRATECEFTHDEIALLKNDINLSLVLPEHDFPVTLHNITTHTLRHMVEGIEQFGPLYGTKVFPFERLNS